MPLSIHLLGPPRVFHDGAPAIPRGRKTWALLAFLVRGRAELRREDLAESLFAEADDPLGALRWNLTDLRRILGADVVPKGGAVRLELPGDAVIDIEVLESSSWRDVLDMTDLGREFLEGVHLSDSPAFEAWLLNQRRHVRGTSLSLLREATLALLGTRRGPEAADLAARLVAMDPLDEDHQRLAIRAYAAAGDEGSAREQASRATDLFRRELGVEPRPSFESELVGATVPEELGESAMEPSLTAQIEAGTGAVKAGALEPGLLHFRRAAGLARERHDPSAEMRAIFGIGAALAHAGQKRHAESATALHNAVHLAEDQGDDDTRLRCYLELAWIEVIAARYERALLWIDGALAISNDAQQARLLAVKGMGLTEMARYGAAVDCLTEAVDRARSTGDLDEAAHAATILGRAYMLRGELDEAQAQVETALDIARARGWTWLIPWPECYLAEIMLARGDHVEAKAVAEHAATLARELGDPSFEAKAARVAGNVAAAEGDKQRAMSLLREALAILDHSPDSTWLEGYILDSLCRVGAEAGLEITTWIDRLEMLAGRTGMRELLVRAYLHRTRSEPKALESARFLAVEVDNPALHREIEDIASYVSIP